MPDDSPILIQYAPPASPVRRAAKRWALPVVLLLVAASAYGWGPPLARRVQLAYWQYRCARHTFPTGQVVLEGDPDRAKALIASGYQSTGGSEPFAYTVPPEWEKFYTLLSPPGFRSQGTAFVHKMRTPGGRDRLVAVNLHLNLSLIGWEARVFEPGTVLTLPRELRTSKDGTLLSDGSRGRSFRDDRVFAGKLDPANPSHFTIELETGAPEPYLITFDGWLRDDDDILIEERRVSSSLTLPPPSSPGRSPSPAGSASTRAAASGRAGG